MPISGALKLLRLKKVVQAEAKVNNATDMIRARIAGPAIEGTTQDLKAAIGNFNTIEKRLDAFDARRGVGRNSTDRLSSRLLKRPNTRVIGGQGTTRDALGNKATTNTLRGNNPPRKVKGRRNSRSTDPADRLNALDAFVRTSNKALAARVARQERSQ